MSLNDAPAHIQLAVDLIELLEVNEVKPELALAALAIVTRDFERKLDEQTSHGND
ncbi:pleiotropic regulatory protein RsmS [Oceanimonas marisflavi]|uniref:pleiotropic regulatory protein RsmS n=1 Tax=Oceanimonas marisflavi TaxID=2059724 RepID=UPI000D314297|nr:pleiotropic regulatory protein RsmS [Oceanimonas marisflavi]